MSRTILFYNGKGGVGKSTLAVLFAEWLLNNGYKVSLEDAEGAATRRFIENCEEFNRANLYRTKRPDVAIIDSRGAKSSAAGFFKRASVIVIPFEATAPAVDETIETFDQLAAQHQRKVVFINNMMRAVGFSRDSLNCLNSIKMLAVEEGILLLHGPMRRDAVYPPVHNGLPKNFFEFKGNKSFTKAQSECDELFAQVARLLVIGEKSRGSAAAIRAAS